MGIESQIRGQKREPEEPVHRPVLLEEILQILDPQPAGIYVDATVGAGGHAVEIAKRLEPGRGLLIGLDWDAEMLEHAQRRLAPFADRVCLLRRNFRELETVLDELNIQQVDGVLFDLGVSSLHFDRPERGFSFRYPGPLDMRMDRKQSKTAADIVNTASRDELIKIFREYGEERWAARIADAIVRARQRQRIETTDQLVELILQAIPAPARRRSRVHPATRVFQALRIAVNEELENLKHGLDAAFRRLKPGGLLLVISFHSLEDRIVKRFFYEKAGRRPQPLGLPSPPLAQAEAERRAELLKLIRPSPQEIAENPRARSAKLRVLRKLR